MQVSRASTCEQVLSRCYKAGNTIQKATQNTLRGGKNKLYLQDCGLCCGALGWLQADVLQGLLHICQPVLEQHQELVELQLA